MDLSKTIFVVIKNLELALKKLQSNSLKYKLLKGMLNTLLGETS